MSVIDLGEVGADPPAPAPVADRSPRPPVSRWSVLAVLGVLLLATAAGSAPLPRPPTGVTIPARLGAPVLLAPDRVFVVDTVGPLNGHGDREIAAYRLPDGELLWRSRPAPWPEQPELRPDALVGGVLVVSLGRRAGMGHPPAASVAGLDARTGRVRWRHPGFLGADLGRSLLLWQPATSDESTRFIVVDTASGEERWSLALPEPQPVIIADTDAPDRKQLVLLGRDRVQLRDADTGVPHVERRMPRALSEPPFGQVEAGLLLVQDYGFRYLTAYGLPRLDRRWRITLRADEVVLGDTCGDVLCLSGATGVRAIDPADGRVRWSNERVGELRQVGDRLILLTHSGEARPQTVVVLDPETGRQLGDFGPWSVVDSGRADGRVLATRRRVETGRTQVALLDPGTLTVRTVAMLDRISGECEVAGDVLLCRRLDSSLGVWTLPS